MNIKLVGKNLEDIRPLLGEYGFVEADRDIELVICHGGDGALLGAEREFPGVLKFPIRDNATAPVCSCHTLEARLRALAEKRYEVTELPKLSGRWQNEEIQGINDIFIHNKICCGALRYSVTIDGKLYAPEIIGDGVGLSTVHGSTAYFRSITRGVFRTGVGLAFSNATAEVSHLILPETSVIEIKILRGPGLIIADNSPVSEIVENEVITLSLAPRKAAVVGIEDFMCPDCCKTRHRRGN